MQRRQCRTCQQTGHNVRACRRQAQEGATTTLVAPLSANTAPAATNVDSEAIYYKVKDLKTATWST